MSRAHPQGSRPGAGVQAPVPGRLIPSPARRRGDAARAPLRAFLTMLALGLAACSPQPPSAAPPSTTPPSASLSASASPSASAGSSLAILASGPGHATIDLNADGSASSRAIQPPAGDVRWLAADAAGGLVATLADGTILRGRIDTPPTRVTAAVAPIPVDWQPIRLSPLTPDPPLSFAVPSSSGDRLAAISARVGTGLPSSLGVIAGEARLVPLPLSANGAAPAWLDGRRIVVAGLDENDRPVTAVVDASSWTVSAGPPDVRAVAVSADGVWVATTGDDQRTVSLEPAAAWLVGRSPASSGGKTGVTTIPTEPQGVATALAIDPGGRSLAIVWTDTDLVPRVVVRYDADRGWQPGTHLYLPAGTVRAAVTFLPAGAGDGPP
jgi:hypothetical protein